MRDSTDLHRERYSIGAQEMATSAVRTLFVKASRPGLVSLAAGLPDVSALPVTDLADLTARLLRRESGIALQYGAGCGDPELRTLVVDLLALEQIHCTAEDVLITVGSQHGLDLLTRVFCDRGDVVLVEAPTYVGALTVFAVHGVKVVHVPMDGDGLSPSALRDTLSQLSIRGRVPKFLYTMPSFHNPAGVCQPPARRAEILDVCLAANLLIVEDNPYGLLPFDGDIRPALRSLNSDRVVYLGSASKLVAPGLRIGWAVAPPGVRDRLTRASEASMLCPPMLSQRLLGAYLQEVDWQRQLRLFRDLYLERRNALLFALARHLPEGGSRAPSGGFYLWMSLPGTDTDRLLAAALRVGVAFVPGRAFYADGRGGDELRVSFCCADPATLVEGARRLGEAFNVIRAVPMPRPLQYQRSLDQ